MPKNVIIFTMDGCNHCKELKDKLIANSLAFSDYEISKYPKIWEQVLNQTGENLIPTVFIKEDENNEGLIYIPGKDFDSIDEMVEIIRNM